MNAWDKQQQFVDAIFDQEKNSKVLFSLQYQGKLLNSCMLKKKVNHLESTSQFEKLEVIYEIEQEVLQVRVGVKIYHDFSVIECLPYIENIGKLNSGIIENFTGLDLLEDLPEQDYVSIPPLHKILTGVKLDVRYNLGSYAAIDDFVAQKRELRARPGVNLLSMKSSEGRSSSSFLPYFGIDIDGHNGLNIGVGWGGAWKSDVEIMIDNNAFCQANHYRITLSMLTTHFFVEPGERLRQVGFFIQFRAGKTIRDAQNELRQFMIVHHAPYDSKGKLIKPPVSMMTWGGLSSEKMLDRINAIKQHKLPYDVFWIDAGWSGFAGECPHFLEKDIGTKSDWPIRVGNWNINTVPHPHGLRPVSNAARKAGMKFLAWIEPERVHKDCRGSILTEHPEWLIANENNPSFLFNLGNPEALIFMFETLRKLILEEGIDIYREDFNFNTLPYWKQMDAPDRIGVAEMKHVEAHYRLWEMLRREFPDMLIDNCASGGRRLDFMTLTNSIALCQSDYACFLDYNVECVQTENFYLNDWIPLHTGFTWMPEHAPYDFFSCAGTGVSNKIWQYDSRVIAVDHDWDYHRSMLEHNIKMRELSIAGDYYPLTEKPEDLTRWCASQMHDPQRNAGFVLAFRREKSTVAKEIFSLRGLNAGDTYILRKMDGATTKATGAALMSGLEIIMDKPRSVTLIYYEKQGE